MSNFYKQALEEFLKERKSTGNLRRESDITEAERELILTRAKELEAQHPKSQPMPQGREDGLDE
jgi:hypothetical protein